MGLGRVEARPRARLRVASRRAAATFAGAVVALVVAEAALRPLVEGWFSSTGRIRTIRQYTEGVATSHFEADGLGTYGNRLTGEPVLPGVPVAMIVGDSHVVQDSVSDAETIGAGVERLARGSGQAINIKQYGWYDASAAAYIGESHGILVQHPIWVAVLLNPTDFGPNALETDTFWRMRVHADDTFDLVDVRTPPPTGRLEQVRELLGRSSLLLSFRRRAVVLGEAGGDAAPSAVDPSLAMQLDHLPRASVKGLKATYGDRLLIVYTPWMKARGDLVPDAEEARLLAACAAEQVACASTRPEMSAAADADHRMSRGFSNTAPGEGHLNATGTAITAMVIWREIARRFP